MLCLTWVLGKAFSAITHHELQDLILVVLADYDVPLKADLPGKPRFSWWTIALEMPWPLKFARRTQCNHSVKQLCSLDCFFWPWRPFTVPQKTQTKPSRLYIWNVSLQTCQLHFKFCSVASPWRVGQGQSSVTVSYMQGAATAFCPDRLENPAA